MSFEPQNETPTANKCHNQTWNSIIHLTAVTITYTVVISIWNVLQSGNIFIIQALVFFQKSTIIYSILYLQGLNVRICLWRSYGDPLCLQKSRNCLQAFQKQGISALTWVFFWMRMWLGEDVCRYGGKKGSRKKEIERKSTKVRVNTPSCCHQFSPLVPFVLVKTVRTDMKSFNENTAGMKLLSCHLYQDVWWARSELWALTHCGFHQQ